MELLFELLFEFLFAIPELLFDFGAGGYKGLTAKVEDGKPLTDQIAGINAVMAHMAQMSPDGRKKMLRFNRFSFIIMALITIAIAIITIFLMESYSGWFWILGITVEIVVTVFMYRAWKRKALAMNF